MTLPNQARLKSATALVCAAPAHASGAVRVRVSLNGGADFGGASLPYAYTCDGHAAIVPCVLDEGCGWCGPATLLAAERAASVRGLTIARAQAKF